MRWHGRHLYTRTALRIPISRNLPSSVISRSHFSHARGRWLSSCDCMVAAITFLTPHVAPTFRQRSMGRQLSIGAPRSPTDTISGRRQRRSRRKVTPHCTSGQCASGQLSLPWFLKLDGWVPRLPIRTVKVHSKVQRPQFEKTGAVPARGSSVQIERTRSHALPSRSDRKANCLTIGPRLCWFSTMRGIWWWSSWTTRPASPITSKAFLATNETQPLTARTSRTPISRISPKVIF